MYSFGMRFDNDSNAITTIDEVNETAVTKGYVNGEYVEFGGGESSDFSTAEVTIGNSSASTIQMYLAYCDDEFGVSVITSLSRDDEREVIVPLYKGKAECWVDSESVSITGDVSDEGDGYYTITGDCTITIS